MISQNTEEQRMVRKVTSDDGTFIACERSGSGPAVVLVCGASTTRMANAPLAALLSSHFTVFNYDRRGRGDSGDTLPYAVEREVEDLEAIINEAGGSALVFGTSSGAALAIEAVARGLSIRKLALWEPPFVVDEGDPRPPADHESQFARMIASGRRGEAVEFFMSKIVGLPAEFVAQARKASWWQDTEDLAHTLVYDAAIMGDYSLPVKQLHRLKLPTLVVGGGASPPVLRHAVRAVADVLPRGKQHTLEGQTHNVSPEALAPVLKEFFAGSSEGWA